jgi:hypothetical protein
VQGCTQPEACNYNSLATAEDFSCVYGCIAGCTDANACNFDAFAEFDNGSCNMPGCMVAYALNYDPSAGCEGTCYFECIADLDANGTMDMSDFLAVLNMFGCIQSCEPFDLDDDMVVGVTDLQLFIASYGILCGE